VGGGGIGASTVFVDGAYAVLDSIRIGSGEISWNWERNVNAGALVAVDAVAATIEKLIADAAGGGTQLKEAARRLILDDAILL
jgi:hypothetical protein